MVICGGFDIHKSNPYTDRQRYPNQNKGQQQNYHPRSTLRRLPAIACGTNTRGCALDGPWFRYKGVHYPFFPATRVVYRQYLEKKLRLIVDGVAAGYSS